MTQIINWVSRYSLNFDAATLRDKLYFTTVVITQQKITDCFYCRFGKLTKDIGGCEVFFHHPYTAGHNFRGGLGLQMALGFPGAAPYLAQHEARWRLARIRLGHASHLERSAHNLTSSCLQQSLPQIKRAGLDEPSSSTIIRWTLKLIVEADTGHDAINGVRRRVRSRRAVTTVDSVTIGKVAIT
jgi:hypothetical protein